MTRVVTSVAELREVLGGVRRRGRRIGLVPTMGALHAGHSSLVRAAREDCDLVVASVFVNPLQFGPEEDYRAYPRTFEEDLATLDAEGVAVCFHPDTASFTPTDRRTTVHVSGLSERWEGVSRPGHFDGVATIVTKLFAAVLPDRAYFGEKDYQQLVVIRRLVADLDLPVSVVGCPTVRDPDGLALSSRNAYLSDEDRARALALSRALRTVAEGFSGDPEWARTTLRTMLEAAPGLLVDYAEVVDPETLEPLEGVTTSPARALVAAHVGPGDRRTRLIDNIRLDPGRSPQTVERD